MTADQLQDFLLLAAGFCGVLAAVNLLLVRRRGKSAYALSGASAVLAVAILLYLGQSPSWLLYCLGGLVIGLLMTDFALRSGQTRRRP